MLFKKPMRKNHALRTVGALKEAKIDGISERLTTVTTLHKNVRAVTRFHYDIAPRTLNQRSVRRIGQQLIATQTSCKTGRRRRS